MALSIPLSMSPSAFRSFRAFAVQPKWQASDFVTAGAFKSWMQSQLEMARPHLAPDRPNLVVLTELNGLPLVLKGGGWALRFKTFERVALALFMARLGQTLPIMLREKVSAIRALQLASADENARLYLKTCQELARKYGVYLCCGSLPMPRYFLQVGKIRVGEIRVGKVRAGQPKREAATLTNQTIILDPQGNLVGTTDKVYLTPDEEAGGVDLSAGQLAEMRVFPTPVGDLGVAISLDAFKPDVIGTLERQGCTVLLQPDANGAPWTSLEGLPPLPPNTEHLRTEHLRTEHLRDQPVAWLESSWTASTSGTSIRYAINPMVVGNLLDMTFDGQSAITGRKEDAPQLQSYVLTTPREGFIALAPWVSHGTPVSLRQIGKALAAGSGDALENQYLSDLLWADLELPPSQLAPPALSNHEKALQVILREKYVPKSKFPTFLLGLGLTTLYALWLKR